MQGAGLRRVVRVEPVQVVVDGGVLTFAPAAWRAFVALARTPLTGTRRQPRRKGSRRAVSSAGRSSKSQ